MDKKYLAQIIATDNEGLQMISACTAGAKVKVADIKYLASNKVFLLSIERTKIETDQEEKKIKSIDIKTAPYPGFPTDLQAQMMVLLCKANKQSVIKEDIFENRFMHLSLIHI